tara:strand:+ start:663 stop:1127 length:465 start_codon:yes stop_codon:yes gene_type:complete
MGVLTVSIKEELTLNGAQQGGVNTVTIASVTQSFKRIVTLPNGGEATVAVIKDAVTTSAVAVDEDDVKYIRITNLDASNSVNLRLLLAANDTATDQAVILLQPGRSFMMGTPVDALVIDADHTNASYQLIDLESIIAKNNAAGATTQLEVFIAS